MVVVQREGTREMCHRVFEDYIGQIKVHQSPDRSVLGFAPVSSSGPSPSSSVFCLATPIARFYDLAKYKAPGLKYSVLPFCPM